MKSEEIAKTENNQKYLSQMKPVFFKRALYSDTTENYVSPSEPNPYAEVKITFRTARGNVDRVYLISGNEEIPMSISSSGRTFDYYTCKVFLNDEPFKYYFRVEAGKIKCVFDALGISKDGSGGHPFVIIPGFKTPDWAKGAVMYQIFTERFCNGDPTNDVDDAEYYYVGGPVKKITDWYQLPATDDVREFYGGDLQGVINKLDYLSDLGIEVIYFNPLFVSPSNHKYDSQDYEHIDPHFGKIVKDGGECLKDGDNDNRNATKYRMRVCSQENLTASDELFIKLVEEAHKRGIKVILDGVFNHCGSFNKWLDREHIYDDSPEYEKGAYVSGESPYRSYFDFKDKEAWPDNASYDGWWGYDTLPKLNYEGSPELFNHILDIAAKWVSQPFNADGWRLDVAADLGHSPEFNHAFYKKFRRRVKEANPDALILAEHYGDPSDWLNGKEWDSVMNYDAFMEPVTWFLTGMQKHSDDFRPDLVGNTESFLFAMVLGGNRFTMPSLMVAMNQLSNHDHSRFLTRTNQKVGRLSTLGPQAASEGINLAIMRLAVMIQMTWPGAPTLYYGDEAGLTGFTDPDNRRTYPWGNENPELISYHREMIRIHKEQPELKTGSIKILVREPSLLAYARFTRCECVVVVINRDTEKRVADIPVWEAVCIKDKPITKLMLTTGEGYSTERMELTPEGGNVKITMEPLSGMVFKVSENREQR